MEQINKVVKTEAVKTEVKFDKAAYITSHGGTKSSAIRALTADGKTRGEVAKLLDIRYQHVRNVLITPIKKAVTK